jgi:hypothetical protein
MFVLGSGHFATIIEGRTWEDVGDRLCGTSWDVKRRSFRFMLAGRCFFSSNIMRERWLFGQLAARLKSCEMRLNVHI